jgi:hypothetical protein
MLQRGQCKTLAALFFYSCAMRGAAVETRGKSNEISRMPNFFTRDRKVRNPIGRSEMRKIGSFGLAVFLAVLASTAIAQGPPPAPPTPLAATEGITNPNTTPAPSQAQQSVVMFDVKKLAATTRPAVALVTVLDKSGKPLKLGTGFYIRRSDAICVTLLHDTSLKSASVRSRPRLV